MLIGVDHIAVRCSQPTELINTLSAQLDVPILIPVRDYGDFCSGLLRIGNLDIEFVRIGKEAISAPYFYGIGFSSVEDVWNTAAWLKASKIPHTLPIHTAIMRDDRQWGWSTILLQGFLDDPIPAPYLLGVLAGDSLPARSIAAVTNTLMKLPAIRRFTSRKAGSSMCFVCHYDQDLSGLRSIASQQLKANGGGKNQIVEVQSIVVEANHQAASWETLLKEEIHNPKLVVESGARNRIREIVIKTESSTPVPTLNFGNAIFSFQP